MLTRFTKESGKYLFETQRFIDGKTKANRHPPPPLPPGLTARLSKLRTWPCRTLSADPIACFQPLVLFAKLPNAQIAARTPAQWERLKTQKTVNPILANAHVKAQLKSLREIAGCIRKRSSTSRNGTAGTSPPTSSPRSTWASVSVVYRGDAGVKGGSLWPSRRRRKSAGSPSATAPR